MPTTRPRHQVTETPEIARALDLAARRWPGESRARLLTRLVLAGRDIVEDELGAAVARRRQAVRRTSGTYAEAFGPNYLAELRQDWAE